jgi:2-polyprenyl-3-methyl-5-hydroxy-6-metoxy-1,4-benzoquinol methylase
MDVLMMAHGPGIDLDATHAHDGSMDRTDWLSERRASVEADYTRDAGTYDDGYDPVTPVHRRFVERLIATIPEEGSILDAPCGTGPYFGLILSAGRRVVGADQSAGMLERAKEKHPDVPLEYVGLQELSFDGRFDAAMCVDAMEHVPPEEWLLVLGNLRRSIRREGHLYLTIEQVDESRLERAFDEASAAGLSVVFGDRVDSATGGYHHYPDREQVRRWLDDAQLVVIDEADEDLGDYGYHHLLCRLEG